MIPVEWKKRISLFVLLGAGLSGLLFFLRDGGGHRVGMARTCSAASVAEAKTLPEKAEPPSAARMLGAQVLVFGARTYQEVEQSIVEMKRAGVNTLIVRAFQNRGDRMHPLSRPRSSEGAYFETAHAPVVDPILTEIVTIGHRHGLKIFAWLETRKMPLHLEDPQSAQALSYDFETGGFRRNGLWSIFDESFQQALEGLYSDAARTGVDGILIQDDLIMYQHEDFGPKAKASFTAESGLDLSPGALYQKVFQDETGRWCVSHYSDAFWVWVCWKNQKLLGLAERLIAAAKAVNPDIQIAVNFMYEAVTDPKNALAWLSQSLPAATKLPIDYYAIMAYHRQIRQELNLSEEGTYDQISKMTAALLQQVDDPHRILMKIQMTDWKTRKEIPSYEANQVLERINNQGRVSLAFIPYSSRVPLHIIGNHFQ